MLRLIKALIDNYAASLELWAKETRENTRRYEESRYWAGFAEGVEWGQEGEHGATTNHNLRPRMGGPTTPATAGARSEPKQVVQRPARGQPGGSHKDIRPPGPRVTFNRCGGC